VGRRPKRSNPISLFSFQDIVTSVTGIMVLVTLLMALELSQRQLGAPAVQTAAIADDLQAAIASAEHESRTLEARIAAGGDAVNEMAGFDANRVKAELADLKLQTPKIERDIAELRQRVESARGRRQSAQAKHEARRADRELADQLAEKIAQTQQRMERLRTSNRIIYNRAKNAVKDAWIVETTDQQIAAAPLGTATRPTVFVGGTRDERVNACLAWAKGRDRAKEYFLLIVKPDGIETFSDLRDGLSNLGFDLGFDVVAADQTVIDPETGAGI
jgi:hypothetical protein